MAFKSIDDYNEARYGGFFLLQNDGDFKDVIFLYQSTRDVLVGDVHYVKSADYSGYVQCCGKGCPACAKGLRVQGKMFVPMYVVDEDEVEYWDRSIRFSNILSSAVFSKFPNPSDFVFRITRRGAAGDRNTVYEIKVVGRNTVKSYSQIVAEKGLKFPESYNTVCKDLSIVDMQALLDTSSSYSDSGFNIADMPSYQITPRNFGHTDSQDSSTIPNAGSFEIPDMDFSDLQDSMQDSDDSVQF